MKLQTKKTLSQTEKSNLHEMKPEHFGVSRGNLGGNSTQVFEMRTLNQPKA